MSFIGCAEMLEHIIAALRNGAAGGHVLGALLFQHAAMLCRRRLVFADFGDQLLGFRVLLEFLGEFGDFFAEGIDVAANFSGTQSDWMVELGSLYPDIVRIEASDLLRHDAIAALTDTVHSFGAEFLVREIESMHQLAVILRTDADYLQGNLLSEPVRAITAVESLPVSTIEVHE